MQWPNGNAGSVVSSHLDHATLFVVRLLLDDPAGPRGDRSLRYLQKMLETFDNQIRLKYPGVYLVIVVVGHNPRFCHELTKASIIDYPSLCEPVPATLSAMPQIIYRGPDPLGLGDVYRAMIPWALSLDANLIITDGDFQVQPENALRFAQEKLRQASLSGRGCLALPTRLVRYFNALERQLEEDLLNAAIRLAAEEMIQRDVTPWANGYPIRDAQSSLFVYSSDLLRAVSQDQTLVRYMNAFNESETIWATDLVMLLSAVRCAVRSPDTYAILTGGIIPECDNGHDTINYRILSRKWVEVELHTGVTLNRVEDAVIKNPERFLQPDVLAALDYDISRIVALVRHVCEALRREAHEAKLALKKSAWERTVIADFDNRASRIGDWAVLSTRYPTDEFEAGATRLTKAQLEFMADDLPGKSTIEFGAGNGRLTKHLVKHAAELTAVECSPMMMKRLQARLGEDAARVKFVLGFAQDISTGHYDIGVSSLVLIHQVPDERFQSLVKAMQKSCDTLYIFENVASTFHVSRVTRLRSEAELLQAFKGFRVVKRQEYRLFDDVMIFLKLVKSGP